MKGFAGRLIALALMVLLGASIGSLAQDTDSDGGDVTALVNETVVMTVTSGPTNFADIDETAISAGTLANSSAFVIKVDAITNFTVDALLTATATTSTAAPVGSSLQIGATASGAGGTTAVSDTSFDDVLSTPVSLDAAFSNVNNSDGTGELSTISLTLDLSELGDREAAETLTYTLSFLVTET